MPVSLLDRDSLKYPEHFWREVEKSNSQKGKNAPVAVILQAIADDEEALGLPPTQSRILQIGKTHQIALKSIDAGHLVGPKIREIAQTTGKSPKLLVINAHGDPRSMAFGKKHWHDRLFCKNGRDYHDSDVKTQDYSDLAPDAQIHLPSCQTGKFLAQKIANTANRTVFAPTGVMFSEKTCLLEESDNKFRMLSYNDRGLQHVLEFKPNKNSELFSDTLKSAKKKSLFSPMIDYVKHHASKGDADSQCSMGFWCLNGIDKQPNKEAVRWLRLAADQRNRSAQYAMGMCYFRGWGVDRSVKEAVRWFRLSADQGNGAAQHKMGMCYVEGCGGLVKSDKEALKWFHLAAHQGDVGGLLSMGVFYSQGRGGLVKSAKEAVKWFHLAAKQDGAKAQYIMAFHHLFGSGGLVKSDKAALRWLRLAANQGYGPAQRMMGVCHLQGRGGLVKSDKEAERWFRLAADQDDIDAHCFIANC